MIPGDAAGTGDRDDDSGDLILNYKHRADGWPLQPGDVVINYNPPNEFSVSVAAVDSNGQIEPETLDIRPRTVGGVVALGIVLVAFLLLLFVVFRVARYVAAAFPALFLKIAVSPTINSPCGVRSTRGSSSATPS